MCAQGLDCADRRDVWKISEQDYWKQHKEEMTSSEGRNEMSYLVNSILDKYITHINPHIKQVSVSLSTHSMRVKVQLKLLVWEFNKNLELSVDKLKNS